MCKWADLNSKEEEEEKVCIIHVFVCAGRGTDSGCRYRRGRGVCQSSAAAGTVCMSSVLCNYKWQWQLISLWILKVPEPPYCTNSDGRTCVNVLAVTQCEDTTVCIDPVHLLSAWWRRIYYPGCSWWILLSQLSRSGGSMLRYPPAAGRRGLRAAQRDASGI